MPEIWIVNQYAITPDLPGGTRQYDLGIELVRRGFKVKIFASDVNLSLRKRTKLQLDQMYVVEPRDGLEFIWVRAAEYQINNWRRTWNMLSFSSNFYKVAKRLGSRPDVIIGSSPHPFAALAAERAAARFKSRFVLELRDLWPQALIDMAGLSEMHPGVMAMRMLERYLYPRADKIMILAKGSEGYLRERGVERERMLFLPNGVHLGHFTTKLGREDARAHYGFGKFTIVYAGAHGPANSLDTVIKAAKLLTDVPVEFVLVGDGPAKANLQALAEREGVTNVRLMDPIPKGEVADLLNAADAGVITLLNAKAFAYGISPNKLFDYMAAARPILCSIPGDMADLVREAKAGLVSRPEDPVALAGAVRQLLAMSDGERTELGRNGQDHLSRYFRRELLADRLAETMTGLLK